MRCPNCDKEMKDKSYAYYGMGSWDMDYPDGYHEEHRCSRCKIRFVKDAQEEWTIPDSIRATDKQLNAALLIERNTGIDMPPPIKKLMCKYIGDNIELSKRRYEEYKQAKEQLFVEWCEDNSDWLPEYF